MGTVKCCPGSRCQLRCLRNCLSRWSCHLLVHPLGCGGRIHKSCDVHFLPLSRPCRCYSDSLFRHVQIIIIVETTSHKQPHRPPLSRTQAIRTTSMATTTMAGPAKPT